MDFTIADVIARASCPPCQPYRTQVNGQEVEDQNPIGRFRSGRGSDQRFLARCPAFACLPRPDSHAWAPTTPAANSSRPTSICRQHDLRLPTAEEPLDQGDVIDGCPVTLVTASEPDRVETAQVELDLHRVIVLTQTCDLANQKANAVLIASVFDAQDLVDTGVVKVSDLRGPIRAGRVYGLYFLPADAALELGEMVIDLRRVHTIRPGILSDLCRAGTAPGPAPDPIPRTFG